VYAASYFARGDQLRLDHLAVFGFYGLFATRRLRPKTAAQRLRHAHRWARHAVAIPLLVSALIAMSSTGWVLWLAWRHGYVQANRPVDAGTAQFEAWRDVLWNAADSIPLLELTTTLHWQRPALYAEDTIASVILVLGKIFIFSPTIAAIVALFRRATFNPDADLSDDEVELVVIEALARSERGRAMDWARALDTAGSRISDTPEEHDNEDAGAGPTWTPDRLVDYLVIEMRPA
jgi:hypothetical protein